MDEVTGAAVGAMAGPVEEEATRHSPHQRFFFPSDPQNCRSRGPRSFWPRLLLCRAPTSPGFKNTKDIKAFLGSVQMLFILHPNFDLTWADAPPGSVAPLISTGKRRETPMVTSRGSTLLLEDLCIILRIRICHFIPQKKPIPQPYPQWWHMKWSNRYFLINTL